MSPILFPLLAAIIGAGDVVFEKYIFDNKRSKYKIFVPCLFGGAFLFLIIFFYPFLGEISWEAKEPIFLLLLLSVVILGAVRNMLYYYSFQKETLYEIQPFMAFIPLVTVLMAGAIYPDERNVAYFVLAVVASLALVFSHMEKKHFKIRKAMWPIVVVVFLEGIENNIIKELLYVYSPVAMYTIRSGLIALALFIFLKPKISTLTKKEVKNLLVASFFWVLTMIFAYYGYQKLGVVYTSLIMMLAPVLVVFGSWLVFKNKKIKKRSIVALIVIIVCVALAQILG